MTTYAYAAGATLLVVLLLFATALNVGRARGLYGVKAPATTGNEMFERIFRVQMNTQEGALQMLPALWLFSAFVSDRWAGLIGLVWVLARIWYAMAYQKDPATRSRAFTLGFLCFAVLWVGAVWGLVRAAA